MQFLVTIAYNVFYLYGLPIIELQFKDYLEVGPP